MIKQLKSYWRGISVSSLLFICLVLPVNVSAFSFDMWESGVTIADAKILATKESVYLQEAEVDTDPQYDKQYRATLFGRPVIVRLYFTENDRQLYMLSVRWEDSLEELEVVDFAKKIEKILTKKYGRGKSLKGSTSSYRHGAKCHDEIDGIFIKTVEDTISVYHSDKCELVVLKYVDENLKSIRDEWKASREDDEDDADKL